MNASRAAWTRELIGHDVRSVTAVGLSGIKNGDLLRLAAQEYEVFLTIDQLLERQERLPPGLGVITLVAPTNRIESLRPLVPAVLQALESLTLGERVRIGQRSS